MAMSLMAKGSSLLAAAISGAERSYNRSTDDYDVYEDIFKEHFQACCKKYAPEMLLTNIDWKSGKQPVIFLMFHKHYISRDSHEDHVRVMLPETEVVLDISTDAWNRLVEEEVVIR